MPGPNEETLDLSQTTSAVQIPGLQSQTFGDYKIDAELARGGMGVVYKARQLSLNRTVALKMILSGKLAGDDDIKRFRVEAEAAAGLEHPNIVPIYEIGQVDGQHFFSMGFVDGGSLDRLLADRTLPPKQAAQLMIRVADAIQYAHDRGIIHRDLKPANILLARVASGTRSVSSSQSLASTEASSSRGGQGQFATGDAEWIPKVSDFGLAKQLGSGSELTGTGQILGTPGYMPPEQAAGGSDQIDAAADIYSLGAVLYRTLTGRPPFQSSSPMETILQVLHDEPVPVRQLNPAVPSDLETICLKCLQKDPTKRYSTASEFAADLERWGRGDPILARPTATHEKLFRWVRKHPAISTSAAVAMLAAISVLAILVTSNRYLKEQRDIAVTAQAEADKQGKLAHTRLTRAITAVDKVMARVASQSWAMNPALQEHRREILQDAVEFYNGLIADSNNAPIVRWEAAKAHEQVAGAMFILNELKQAQAACSKAIDLCDGLIAEEPENLEYIARKGTILSLNGSILALSGNTKDGFETIRQSVELCRKVSDKAPEHVEYQMLAVESLSNYAYFVLAGAPDDKMAGQKLMPEVMQRTRKLNNSTTAPMVERLIVAFALNVHGAYLITSGQNAEATQAFTEAVDILEQIKDLPAPDARRAYHYLHVRAISLINLGLCNFQGGKAAMPKGIELIDQGIQQLQVLMKLHPSAYVYKLQYAQALRSKAIAHATLGQLEAAKQADLLSMSVLDELIRSNPEQSWLLTLQSNQRSLALVQRAREGKLDDLERDCEALVTAIDKTGKGYDALYNMACAYSQATQFTDTEKDRYTHRAVQLLEQISKNGYFQSPASQAHARSDTDLAPIANAVNWEKLFAMP